MKIAFITEMDFYGTVRREHRNMRTEFAWMVALQAEHFPLNMFRDVCGFDLVIIIWPKGKAVTNSEGIEIQLNKVDIFEQYVNLNVIETLKQSNGLVAFMQEGPSWFFNDYTVVNQIHYYNIMADSDILFVHNEHDILFYKGLFPEKNIVVMPTLMLVNDILLSNKLEQENRTIIGGNFCRWYGGFQSYIIASVFENPIDVPTMYNKRENEEYFGINHLPYMDWTTWIINLSKYKYAVHLMPTVAAGTFSLNCAFWGIPCIGNKLVDTQIVCYPDLSVDVNDLETARAYAKELKNSPAFYAKCSKTAITNMNEYYSEEEFLRKFNLINFK